MNDAAVRPAPWWVGIILLALAIAPFLQVRGFDFVNIDDNLYVTENRVVQQGLTWEGVKHAFTTFEGGNWHPLTWLSHMTDCQLFRQGDGSQWPGGHHLINVALHAINTLLVWVVLRRLTAAAWRSALVTALFAVHPLHVESVAWVAERKDVLSTMFGLLAVGSYIGYARSGRAGRYLAMLGFFILSLLTKPMLVTLPLLLLVLDLWPLRRATIFDIGSGFKANPGSAGPLRASRRPGASIGRLVLEKLPLLGLSIAISIIAVISQRASKAMSSLEAIPITQRLANAVVAYAEYLQKLFVPTDLAVFYPHPGTWPTAKVITSLIILAAIMIMAFAQRKHRPWLIVGWLWFFGMLVPVIGLVQVGLQSMADRYMYLPAVGVFIMIAWSIPSSTVAGTRALTGFLTGAVVLVFALMAHQQVAYWRDSRTLFERAQAVTKNNFMAHQNLGNALERAGDLDAALIQYQRAVDLRGRYGKVRENVANVLIQKGRLDEAIEQIHIAITLDPESFSAHNSLGVIMLAKQRFAEAEQSLRRAVELDPGNIESRGNHGIALRRLNRVEEAIAEFLSVKTIEPKRIGLRIELARAQAMAGRTDLAIAELDDILKQGPEYGPPQLTLQQRAQLHRSARDLLQQLQPSH